MDFIARSIRNKLLLICGGGTAAVLLAAGVGLGLEWSALDNLAGEIERIRPIETQAHHVAEMLTLEQNASHDFVARAADAKSLDQRRAEAEANEKSITEATAKLVSMVGTTPLQTPARDVATALDSLFKQRRSAFDYLRQHPADAAGADAMVREGHVPADKALRAIIEQMDAQMTAAQRQSREYARKSMIGIAFVFALVIVLAFVAFLWALQRHIIGPARRLVSDLERLFSWRLSHANHADHTRRDRRNCRQCRENSRRSRRSREAGPAIRPGTEQRIDRRRRGFTSRGERLLHAVGRRCSDGCCRRRGHRGHSRRRRQCRYGESAVL